MTPQFNQDKKQEYTKTEDNGWPLDIFIGGMTLFLLVTFIYDTVSSWIFN